MTRNRLNGDVGQIFNHTFCFIVYFLNKNSDTNGKIQMNITKTSRRGANSEAEFREGEEEEELRALAEAEMTSFLFWKREI